MTRPTPSGMPDTAYSSLWARYNRQLLRHALLRTRDRDLAEDLVQETWTRAYLRRHTYAGRGSMLGWMLRTLDRIALSHARKEHRRLDLLAAHLASGDSSMAVPPEIMLESDTGNDDPLIRDALQILEKLPPLSRRIAVLHWVEGHPPRHIARLLALQPSTVWTKLSQVRAAIRKRPAH